MGHRLLSAVIALGLLSGCAERLGVDIATGYTAKQVCSGVFVAGLPEDHIVNHDVHMALGVLGPLLSLLEVETDRQARRVSASLLGTRSSAWYSGPTGCVLHGEAYAAPGAGIAAAVDATVSSPPPPDTLLPALDGALDAAFAEPAEGTRHTLAVLVSHRGKRVAERYARPVTAHTPMQSWSMNKSLMSTWIGMQVEQGALDLSAPVASRLAAVDASLAANLDPALNLGHLLHMESGLAFEETYLPGDDATRMLYREPAAWQVAAGNGQAHAPGERFSYSSGDTNLASWVWQQSLEEPYIDWVTREFSAPLGLGPVVVEHDASGVQVGSSYTYMTARDWLRVGEFWLDALKGRSGLLSAAWMQAAVTPRPAAEEGNYGRGFWLNTLGVYYPALPRDTFYAEGHNGQYVMIMPQQEIVIVRLGLSSAGNPVSGMGELAEGVLKVLAPAPLPQG
ncbi:MAG: serine hydrolase [Halieaceae bacterium]|jgi:CubicO group peptidase (beta-lactamase class C family)|nr:serine hydrolase [Halieaceae bacterium]